ncbi:MAG: glycosyltransferase family 87 protein [Thermodesulfobacteriota bacterium]
MKNWAARINDFRPIRQLADNWHQYFVLGAFFVILYPPFLYHYGYKFLNIINTDLPSFWCAAQAAFKLDTPPYDRNFLQTLLSSQHVYPFLYPPPSLFFFYPLSKLSYAEARLAVLAVNHVLVLFLIWFLPIKLMRLSIWKDTLAIVWSSVYILFFYPLALLLDHGQINLLLACSLYLFWFFSRSNRSLPAAIFLVIGIMLKTYPILVILFLLICKKYRIITYSLLLSAGLTTLSLLILPVNFWTDWLLQVAPSGGYTQTPLGLFSPAALGNQSLNGFFARLFTEHVWEAMPILINPALAKALTYASAAVLLSVSLYAVYKRHIKNAAHAFNWAMLIFLPLMYLVAPLSWEHHQVYLLAGIIILFVAALKGELDSIPFSILVLLSAATICLRGLLAFKFAAILFLWYVAVALALADKPGFLIGDSTGGHRP